MHYGEKIDVILKHVNTHMRKWFITIDEKLDLIISRLDALENKDDAVIPEGDKFN